MTPSQLTPKEKYLESFSAAGVGDCVRKEALKTALDIRKFEIDLYWKRATYFWAFITAAFGGFFALRTIDQLKLLAFIPASFGFVFSLGWYFVNRGSKAWQQNWELHVDLLEDAVMGPLHKTVLSRDEYRLWKITDAYFFSPSKINQLLSLFVTLAWGGICLSLFFGNMDESDSLQWFFGFLTVGFLFAVFFARRSNIEGPRTFLSKRRDIT
jgi:hypothetical protein